MASHYETFKDKAGEYRWRLVASNGEPVAASEGYTTEEDARRGADDAHRVALEASAALFQNAPDDA